MFAKTGFGLLAAAGVAVGVIGMTMGGASGASPATCAPTTAGVNSHGAAGANGHHSSTNAQDSGASNAAGANSSSAADGTTGATNADGTTGSNGGSGTGASAPAGSGVSVVVGASVPGAGPTATQGSSGSDSNRDHPFLHVRKRSAPLNVHGVQVPNTGANVVGRSSADSGLKVLGRVNLGR